MNRAASAGRSSRLDVLRRQAGTRDAAGTPVSVPAVHRGDAGHPGSDAVLARRLGGRPAAPGVIERVREFPAGTRWGDAAIEPSGLDALAELAGDPATRRPRSLFWDTETTGLAGGTGTVAFLVGLARFTGGGLRVVQLLLARFAGERALLDAVRRHVGDADLLVTYNGKTFDAPLLATRYRLHGQASPFDARPHLDLLHAVRRAFATAWPDCRLQTAEARLLAMERTGDIPGSEVPDAWHGWLRRGETERLARVLEHNLRDVVTLAALPPALAGAYRAPLEHDASILARARLLVDRGEPGSALAHLDVHRSSLDRRGLRELARLGRRRGNWDLATSVWRDLAAAGDADALESLAKYHEHAARDPGAALALARRLIAAEPGIERHVRRLHRLEGKLARAAETARF